MKPLAATMAGFSMIAVDVDETRIDFRLRTRYVDKKATSLDEALAMIEDAKTAGKPVSVGLLGNAADIFAELVQRGITPDVVTDQTSAHDPLNGYLPQGWTMEYAAEQRKVDESGMVIVADGTNEAGQRLGRVLCNDPGTGVMRHADAGYDIAKDCAKEQGLDLPMINHNN